MNNYEMFSYALKYVVINILGCKINRYKSMNFIIVKKIIN